MINVKSLCAALVALALGTYASPASAQPFCSSFPTLTTPNKTLATGDGNGKCYDLINGVWVDLPAPASFDVGIVGFRKADNTAPYSVIKRADGAPIDLWNFFSLEMHGDYIYLQNTGTEWRFIGNGSWPHMGRHGQHRTWVPQTNPSLPNYNGGAYNVHRGDRGATVRILATGDNGNIYLPPRVVRGWAGTDISGNPGGYRDSYSICFLYLGDANHFVTINGYGHSEATANDPGMPISRNISGVNHTDGYIVLQEPGRTFCFDTDGQGWFMHDYYQSTNTDHKP